MIELKIIEILTESGWSFIDQSKIIAVTLIEGESAEIHMISGTIFTTKEVDKVREIDFVKYQVDSWSDEIKHG